MGAGAHPAVPTQLATAATHLLRMLDPKKARLLSAPPTAAGGAAVAPIIAIAAAAAMLARALPGRQIEDGENLRSATRAHTSATPTRCGAVHG